MPPLPWSACKIHPERKGWAWVCLDSVLSEQMLTSPRVGEATEQEENTRRNPVLKQARQAGSHQPPPLSTEAWS
ncbi:hypothetical protein FQA47_001127 [Oryzias melastigma]|uniref:Uncharacterized protein n=1 Tax=Oryzias melastigma TaxID=30732 RepID=A0A834C191_ORYME|nr:hypothetical protein FQA47_001127 [Oryzias melastigma]